MSTLVVFDPDGMDVLHGAKHTHLAQESENLKRDPGEGVATAALATASCQGGEPADRSPRDKATITHLITGSQAWLHIGVTCGILKQSGMRPSIRICESFLGQPTVQSRLRNIGCQP